MENIFPGQAESPVPASGWSWRRLVLFATVTPLASIFGSGFLIIIPILERELGALAAVGMAGVCLFAWLVGIAIRHNVAIVEPLTQSGSLDKVTAHFERASDLVIIVAYVVSVALYVRILAQFVVHYVTSGASEVETLIAVGVIVVITIVGLIRGLSGLELLEQVSLAAVLLLVSVVCVVFAEKDIAQIVSGKLYLPPVPKYSLGSVFLVLGGILITVQGFETVRYLHHIDRRARVAGCRLSQITSSVVYVLFVALAIPLMGLGTKAGADPELLALVERAAPVLVLPIVLCAVLSQFSAATADTEASVCNIHVTSWAPIRGRIRYALVGIVAAVLAATLSTSVVIVVASRAFAAYYALQCVVALRTSDRLLTRIGYGVLALLLLAITLFAKAPR